MLPGKPGLLLGLVLLSAPALAEGPGESALCIDFFGVGAMLDGKCETLPGRAEQIAASDISSVLAEGAVNLKVVSEDAEEPFDLAPLAGANDVHSLDIFRVGPLDLTSLDDMNGLRRLHLGADAAMALSQMAGSYPALVELDIYAPRRTVDLSVLPNMPALRVLNIKADTVVGQEGLAALGKLERVRFELAEETDLSPLAGLKQIEWLEISGSLGRSVLSDIGFLSELTSLTNLDLNTNAIEDVGPLAGLSNLRQLILSYNRKLSAVGPLSKLTGLRVLQLRGTRVSELDFLRDMDELGVLWLDGAPVSDISALAALPGLWGLELSRTDVTHITPLRNLPLKHLSLQRTKVTDFSPVPAGARLRK